MKRCGLCGKPIDAGVLCDACARLCTVCAHPHPPYGRCETCGHHRKEPK